MKNLFLLLSVALSMAMASSCGAARSGTGSISSAPATDAHGTTSYEQTQPYLQGDDDGDEQAGYQDSDDLRTRDYGHPAGASDTHAITKLIKHYYVAAATENGASACSLLLPRVANGANLGSEAEATEAPAASTPPLGGKSCSYIMSVVFREDHQRLAAQSPTVVITSVRVNANHGLALLGFGTVPERLMLVQRDGHAWKVVSLLDQEVP